MGSFQRSNDEKSKMITNSKQKGLEAKHERETATDEWKFSKAAASNSRQWSGFRNPRIVRVSRSFGGKDRHSKVCTIKGLRDRRIRLSVPTAIQLYDLQDRLGLSQPSKVIDWLLEVAKLDIDKLPPLQLPQGFAQFHQQMAVPHELGNSQPSLPPFFYPNCPRNVEDQALIIGKSKYWDMDEAVRGKNKEVQRGVSETEKGKWIESGEQEEEDQIADCREQVLAQKLLLISNHSSLPGLLNNAMPFNYYHSEPSCLSLSQLGSHGTVQSHVEANTGTAGASLPSGSQLFLCPPTTTTLFPPYHSLVTNPVESDTRQFNHIPFLSTGSHALPSSLPPSLSSFASALRSFPTNVDLKLLHSQNEDSSGRNDGSGS